MKGTRCRRGYNRTAPIPETYIDDAKSRVVYRRRDSTMDLRIVPYNLPMMMDWGSHLNVEYSGSAFSALYIYKYCYKGAFNRELIELKSSDEIHDSSDEIKLFIYGRVMCCMAAVWRLYGYQDYPASEPAVTVFKIRTREQMEDFYANNQLTDLMIYYHRPNQLSRLTYTQFWKQYNADNHLPKYYQVRPALENEKYFSISIPLGSRIANHFIYQPVQKIERCIRIEMLYQTAGEIYYLRLILLKRPVLSDEDARTFHPPRGY